jgi:DNA-binding LytR/AlgR family response regulator
MNQTAIQVIAVDDEPLALRRLSRLLTEAGCQVLAECRSVAQLLESLQSGISPQALFLDIEMPGGSGLEALAELKRPIPIIFVTAFPEHAARAFDADAVDYLVKPVFESRLQKSLEKLRRVLDKQGPVTKTPPQPLRFPAKAAGGDFFLELRKVSHFEFEDLAVWAWLGGKKFRAPWTSLNEVEQAFPEQGLLRIQRHLLLRPEAILSHRSLPGGRALIHIGDGIELEVSRAMTPKLRTLLGIGKGS